MIDLDRLDGAPILVGLRGSEAHNLYLPPEQEMGTDDRDLMGVFVPPKSAVIGLDEWGSRGTKEVVQGKQPHA